MLFKFHFAEHAFALELFLEGPKGLLNVIIADADLHVVFTTFLSLSCTECAGLAAIAKWRRLVYHGKEEAGQWNRKTAWKAQNRGF